MKMRHRMKADQQWMLESLFERLVQLMVHRLIVVDLDLTVKKFQTTLNAAAAAETAATSAAGQLEEEVTPTATRFS